MTRLVLWDLDGTLVHTAGIGGAVFDTALEATLGRRPEDRVRMAGKTDPQIVREYLELMHEDLSHAPAILRHLEQGLAAAAERLAEDGSPMPGVVAVLRRLAAMSPTRPGPPPFSPATHPRPPQAGVPGPAGAEPEVISSVLTGNIAPNAVVKLAAFGLDRWLDLEVGAYGSDDANREVLVPLALERARTLRGVRLDASDVWVVGDTPRDLACASAAGAHCLLVATGGFTIDDLRNLGADVVLADLRQTDEVVAILTGAVTRSPPGGDPT